MILFLRFRRATLLLTRGMTRSLRHQQALEASFVGVRDQRRLAQVSLPLRVLLRQDVTLVRVVAAQPPPPCQLDALAECALGFLFRHVNPRGQGSVVGGGGLIPRPLIAGPSFHFGAKTIDMFRPPTLRSGSTLAMS